MASLKAECRKFSPNIFNKTKCQNCFRGKDAHSSEALESNRATRKVSYCGYLFVAPDWDFSLPANRNKRWQRRWFVLYDDGELAYSLDEHPETVPQAIIDMNCVLEVTDAENVTGNLFAIAVTCPEKVHFIKGTSKDESKKWFEVLSRFPENTVCGKYKRNATFPCIKSSNVPKVETNAINGHPQRRDTVDTNYTKLNGYSNNLIRSNLKQNSGVIFDPDDDVYPTKDTNSSPTVTVLEKSFVCDDKKKQETLTNHIESNSIKNTDKIPPKSEKKYQKLESRENRKLHSHSDVTKMIPVSIEERLHLKSSEWSKKLGLDLASPECLAKNFHNNVCLLMSEGKKFESYENFFGKEKTRCIRRQNSFGRKSDLQKQILSDRWDEEMKGRTIHKSASVPDASLLKEDNKILTNGTSKEKYAIDSPDRASPKSFSQVRGDPDGCNPESMPSSHCASTAEFGDQTNDSLFLKKGWLVKQDDCKWNKYWFVLRNSALTYYSDPIAEDAGILDGFVDLRKVKSVAEVESSSGFTFCVLMKDFQKLYLSAVTSKIRNNWIRAIVQAANLKDTSETLPRKRSNDRDLYLDTTTKDKAITETTCPDSPVSSLDSSEKSSKGAIEDQEDQLKNNSIALPPSPPLARTAISRVKERARTRTRSNSRTRSSRFRSTEIHESDHNYLADSDGGTSDHSSSSLHNTTLLKEKKTQKESPPKNLDNEKPNRLERRRSFKISNLDSLTFPEGRRKVTDVKDKLEDSSWTIWLDISKFCKEVECKLDDLEEKTPTKNGPHLSGEQKKEIGNLASSLGKVEDRLQRVHNELEKAKVTLMLNGKDSDLGLSVNKAFGCHSLKQEVSRLSGISSQNSLLAQQLNKVRDENRRLKSEVRTAQTASDDFELCCTSLRKASEQAEKLHQSHMDLMVARVDDLTSKLLISEKVVRQLRQRVAKLEQRQERRRSSLKGKEAMSLSKEYEAKLSELEQKIGAVEGVLNISDNPQDATKESSQSLLMRLHNLDQKVKEVVSNVPASPEEPEEVEMILKPKIRLQVNLNENGSPSLDVSDNWNSLSLSASMTDLPAAVEREGTMAAEEDSLSMSFGNCLESLSLKVTSLVSWLKMSLQLLYAQGHMSPKMDFISGEASEELSKLIRTLDHITGKNEDSVSPPHNISLTVSRLLYNILLLQEITNVVFKMSDYDKYKTSVLVQHLSRVRQALLGIEQYIQQKSNPANSVQKMSLCNIVSCLLFHRSSAEEMADVSDIQNLFEDVESQRKRMALVLTEFKSKFIERFCATILELSEESACDKIKSPDQKPLGQKQFLSHISHIISQVSTSFVSHISKSLNEVYFLCSTFQYSERWTEYICKLLQQELSLLSSEIKGICISQLEGSTFFSSSKCGVLVEYMHCSMSELAQIVAIATVVDGTVVLVKDAIYGEDNRPKNCTSFPEALNTFHENLQHRTASIMANLPQYRFPQAFFSLCNPNELGVAHRSVSSLLCFKERWRVVVESERKDHKSEVEEMEKRIAELQAEQQRRLEAGCRSCIELKQEVSYLQGELEESRVVARTGSLCQKCTALRTEMQVLQEALQQEQAAREKEVEQVAEKKEKQFKEEKCHLEKELQSARRKLKEMEIHYDGELRSLQRSYEKKLNQKNESTREDIKLKYSEELGQLKALCEQGLSAMDATHKKVISELETRHHRELEELMADREKALADEAQATAIALDAVRKAHSKELQKQIQKFKDEFLSKMNNRFQTEAFKKCYESDLTNVKHEILAMSEKYSVKCLENATLQEKLEVMNHQLKSTTTQVVELLAKNQQLQARLTSVGIQKQEESII